MRKLSALLVTLAFLAWTPTANAHGALAINQFDTYAISDFEGQEDSFPWEGWDIWDVYAGDGYNTLLDSHGVYFKVNLAGDGTLRPTGSAVWDVRFTFTVGDEEFTRTMSHDGSDIASDFEQLDTQLADGNVLQMHAWVPVANWTGQSITDLTLLASVDGQPRDIAPGGIYDPVTGMEIPVEAPASPVFPALGEGRLVEEVPLTGAEKFLDLSIDAMGDGNYNVAVTNPLAEQGQHFMFRAAETPGWIIEGAPAAQSLNGSDTLTFPLVVTVTESGTLVEPIQLDFMTDIGGLQTYYAFAGANGIEMTPDSSMATAGMVGEPAKESPGVPLVWVGALALAFAARKRQ